MAFFKDKVCSCLIKFFSYSTRNKVARPEAQHPDFLCKDSQPPMCFVRIKELRMEALFSSIMDEHINCVIFT